MLLALLTALAAHAAAGPSASTTLQGSDGAHPADLAFDGLLTTGWSEGSPTFGEGEWLELDLGKPATLQGVSFWPGNIAEGARSYREYSRPKLVRVLVDGEQKGQPLRLLDKVQRVDVPLSGITGQKIRLVVDEVFEGVVFSDMYITEVAIDYPSDEREEKLAKWREGKEALRLAEEQQAEVDAAYEKCKATEFGDADALNFLMSAAGDGPVYQRARALQLVPPGYRAQAVRSDERAQEALRKVKDANAIPALEQAALRATGNRELELAEIVEIFYAYQEMIGGGNRNVAYWGQSGWEAGALRSYEEPLPIEIDRLGNVLVADTGNNRVQLFGEQGRPERQWGPPPDIANQWFGQGRKWYVSGSAPGEKPGQWVNPIDVEMIPGKDADRWAGLDAEGRVQVFDAEGRQLISWRVETRQKPEAKLGGQAYLLWVPQREWLVAIMKNEAVAYTLDSEEVARWKVTDGTPNAAEVGENGKLLLDFGPNVVQYDATGYRFGSVITDKIFGEGWEDMDLTLDEQGKLWAFTDTGWVFKFKKPGKLDFKVKVVDQIVSRPRIAVREGILFYTSQDKIDQIDVLQVKADQEAAAKKKASKEGGDDEL